MIAEFGNMFGDRLVEVEFAALPLLRDGDGGDGFGRREPDHHRVSRHRHIGSRESQRKIRERFAVPRDVNLAADLHFIRLQFLEQGDGAWQRFFRRQQVRIALPRLRDAWEQRQPRCANRQAHHLAAR